MKKRIVGILALIVLLSACTPPAQNEDSTESSKSYNLKAVGEHYKQERIFVGNYIIQMKAAYVKDGAGIVKFGLFNQDLEPQPFKKDLKITALQNGKETPVELEYAYHVQSEEKELPPSKDLNVLDPLDLMEVHIHLGNIAEEVVEIRVSLNGKEATYQLEPDEYQTEQMLTLNDADYRKAYNIDQNVFIAEYGMIHNHTASITVTRIGQLDNELTDAFDFEWKAGDETIALASAEEVHYKDIGYPTDILSYWTTSNDTKGMDGGSEPTTNEYVFRFPWTDEKSSTEWKLIIRSKKDPTQQVEIPYRLVASPENPPSLFFPLDQKFILVK